MHRCSHVANVPIDAPAVGAQVNLPYVQVLTNNAS